MDYQMLSKTILFKGYRPEEIEKLFETLDHHIKKYSKNDIILHAEEVTTELGLLLSGSVRIENTDLWGNVSILGISQKGDIFAESYACIPHQPLMVDVVAGDPCEILFISIPSLFRDGSGPDGLRMRLISNLVTTASRKNLQLSRRIFYSSSRRIRDRLFAYFSDQITLQGSHMITVPLNRQQMADYLGLDRTALSKELGKMKKEGLLDYHKNTFRIKIDL